uniref:C2H2-type domain-containing protein n=1 Tax=Anopheles triannulatus TaxID=58253 RepID=A0A2M4A4G6_9DIPT
MDTLIECPVCTLYLRSGMNLSVHLDTHPKESVIKALVAIAQKRTTPPCVTHSTGGETSATGSGAILGSTDIFSYLVLGGSGASTTTATTDGGINNLLAESGNKMGRVVPAVGQQQPDALTLNVTSRAQNRTPPNAIMYDGSTTVAYADAPVSATGLGTAVLSASSQPLVSTVGPSTTNGIGTLAPNHTIALMNTCEVSGVTTLSHYPANNVTILKREYLQQQSNPLSGGANALGANFLPTAEPLEHGHTSSSNTCAGGPASTVVARAPGANNAISIYPRYTNELYSGPPPPYSTAISSSVATNTQIVPAAVVTDPATPGPSIGGKLTIISRSKTGAYTIDIKDNNLGSLTNSDGSSTTTHQLATYNTLVPFSAIEAPTTTSAVCSVANVSMSAASTSAAFRSLSQAQLRPEAQYTEREDGSFVVFENPKKIVEYRENEAGELTLFEKIVKSPPWTAQVDQPKPMLRGVGQLQQHHPTQSNDYPPSQQFHQPVIQGQEQLQLGDRQSSEGSGEVIQSEASGIASSSTVSSFAVQPMPTFQLLVASSSAPNACSTSTLAPPPSLPARVTGTKNNANTLDMITTVTGSASTSTTPPTPSSSVANPTESLPMRKRTASGLKVLSNVKVTTDLSQGIKDIILNLNSRNGSGRTNTIIAASSSLSGSTSMVRGHCSRRSVGEERPVVSCGNELIIPPAKSPTNASNDNSILTSNINIARVQGIRANNSNERLQELQVIDEVEEVMTEDDLLEPEELDDDDDDELEENEDADDEEDDEEDTGNSTAVDLEGSLVKPTLKNCFTGQVIDTSASAPANNVGAVVTSVIRMISNPSPSACSLAATSSSSQSDLASGEMTSLPEETAIKPTVPQRDDGTENANASLVDVKITCSDDRKLIFLPVEGVHANALSATTGSSNSNTLDTATATATACSSRVLPDSGKNLNQTIPPATSVPCSQQRPVTFTIGSYTNTNRNVTNSKQVFRAPKKLAVKLIRPLPLASKGDNVSGIGEVQCTVTPSLQCRAGTSAKGVSSKTASLILTSLASGTSERAPLRTNPIPNSITVVIQKTEHHRLSGVDLQPRSNDDVSDESGSFQMLQCEDSTATLPTDHLPAVCPSGQIQQQVQQLLPIKQERPLVEADPKSRSSQTTPPSSIRATSLICSEISPHDSSIDIGKQRQLVVQQVALQNEALHPHSKAAASNPSTPPVSSDMNVDVYNLTFIGNAGHTVCEPHLQKKVPHENRETPDSVNKEERVAEPIEPENDEGDEEMDDGNKAPIANPDSKASVAELIRAARQQFGCAGGSNDRSWQMKVQSGADGLTVSPVMVGDLQQQEDEDEDIEDIHSSSSGETDEIEMKHIPRVKPQFYNIDTHAGSEPSGQNDLDEDSKPELADMIDPSSTIPKTERTWELHLRHQRIAKKECNSEVDCTNSNGITATRSIKSVENELISSTQSLDKKEQIAYHKSSHTPLPPTVEDNYTSESGTSMVKHESIAKETKLFDEPKQLLHNHIREKDLLEAGPSRTAVGSSYGATPKKEPEVPPLQSYSQKNKTHSEGVENRQVSCSIITGILRSDEKDLLEAGPSHCTGNMHQERHSTVVPLAVPVHEYSGSSNNGCMLRNTDVAKAAKNEAGGTGHPVSWVHKYAVGQQCKSEEKEEEDLVQTMADDADDASRDHELLMAAGTGDMQLLTAPYRETDECLDSYGSRYIGIGCDDNSSINSNSSKCNSSGHESNGNSKIHRDESSKSNRTNGSNSNSNSRSSISNNKSNSSNHNTTDGISQATSANGGAGSSSSRTGGTGVMTGNSSSRPPSTVLSSASSTTSSNLERAISTESLNIRTDEKMPAKGEISEQESNGDMDMTSWNRLYTADENIPIYPSSYDLSTAQESWNLSNRLQHQSSNHPSGASTSGTVTNSAHHYYVPHGVGFRFYVQKNQQSSQLEQPLYRANGSDSQLVAAEEEGAEEEVVEDDELLESNEQAAVKGSIVVKVEPSFSANAVKEAKLMVQEGNPSGPSYFDISSVSGQQQQSMLESLPFREEATASSKAGGKLRVYRCQECPKSFPSIKQRRLHVHSEHAEEQLQSTQQQRQQHPQEQQTLVDSKEGIIGNVDIAVTGNSSSGTTVPSSPLQVVMNYNWLKQEIQRKCEATTTGSSNGIMLTARSSSATGENGVVGADGVTSSTAMGFVMGGGVVPTNRKRTYVCGKCKKQFQRFNQFDAHLMEHPVECCSCDRTFKQWRNFSLHIKRHLGIKEHQCRVCGKQFVIKQKLVEHMRIHSGIAPIKCQQCGRQFKRFSNLAQHRNRHHVSRTVVKKDFVCQQCGEVFHSQAKMTWHQEIHEKQPKSCPYCREKFIHRNSLTRHIRLSHTEKYAKLELKTEPCTVCNQPYTRTSMRRHMETHGLAEERLAFACSICNKRFTTNWNLKQHKWTHANPTMKPYQCTICPSGFVRHSDYVTHVNAHRSVRPYTCNHCGRQFIRKYNWIRHTREHESDKGHRCEDCGRKFHRKYYLTEHRRIHTGERPFSCNICGKTSATKTNHNKHVRIHHARDPLTAEG